MSDYYDVNTGEEISDADLHDRYDAMLDELGEVTIGGLSYAHSVALKRVDEIAYRCGFSDYATAEDAGVVESGYWVRVLTADGEEVADFTEWYTEEDDARQAAADFAQVGMDDAPAGEYFVQCNDTSDTIVSEIRVVVR